MKWIKHYENASSNKVLDALLSHKRGHELYGMYWLFLAGLTKEFNKDTEIFTITGDRLCSILRVKYLNKAETFLQVLVEISERFEQDFIKIEEILDTSCGKIFKIQTPIILELLGKEFKRTRANRGQDAAKNKNKNKNKKKEIKKEKTAPVGACDPVDDLEEIKKTALLKSDGPDLLAELWNESVVEVPDAGLPKVKIPISGQRLKRAREAIKQMPHVDDWRKAIVSVLSSEFHTGKNDRGWKADFDWLLQPTKQNYLRMAESYEVEYAKKNI